MLSNCLRGEPADGAETIVAGRRGMLQWRLEARGQAAHSGLHYWDGRSALTAAARWAVEAEALSRRDGGPTVNVGRLVAGDASFVDDLAGAASLLGTERQLNVVPDRAVAEGEASFLRAAEQDEIARRLEALARDVAVSTGTSLAFGLGQSIPPVDPHGPHAAWPRRAVDLAAARGWKLEIENERGGISFPNFLGDPGPRRPGSDRRRYAHPRGVRGSALAAPSDRAFGGSAGRRRAADLTLRRFSTARLSLEG